MARLHTLVIAMAIFSLSSATNAKDMSQEMLDRATALAEQAVERLQLSDEQFEQVKPIVRSGAEKRVAILQDYGVIPKEGEERKRISRKEIAKMKGEIEVVRVETAKELDGVLGDAQMAEYEVMLEESKARVREEGKRRAEEARKEKESNEP